MSPIFQTLANGSAYGYRTLAAGGGTAFESIATATGTGSSATITFSSIPSTYTSLQIRFSCATTDATTDASAGLRFNSDSGSNYTYHWLYGSGSSAAATAGTAQNRIQTAAFYPGTSYASTMGVGVIDIHNYASTTQNKTARIINGWDANGAGYIDLVSGLWLSTTAITSLSIVNISSQNFSTSSTFSLYGIKGA
jgi:hypothetical protein